MEQSSPTHQPVAMPSRLGNSACSACHGKQNPSIVNTPASVLVLFTLLCAESLAETVPAAAPPYYSISYEASSNLGELAMPVTYTIWIPENVKTLRGVIVH